VIDARPFMRRSLTAIGVAALISVVAFKAFIVTGKMDEARAAAGQRSIFGLHMAQPSTMKSFPAELPLP
jgi:hypothetical protein